MKKNRLIENNEQINCIKTISLRLTKDYRDELIDFCGKRNVSLNFGVNAILSSYFEEKDFKNADNYLQKYNESKKCSTPEKLKKYQKERRERFLGAQ